MPSFCMILSVLALAALLPPAQAVPLDTLNLSPSITTTFGNATLDIPNCEADALGVQDFCTTSMRDSHVLGAKSLSKAKFAAATKLAQVSADMSKGLTVSPECCGALAKVMKRSWQKKCPCSKYIKPATKGYDADVFALYINIAAKKCQLRSATYKFQTTTWNSCGLNNTNSFLNKTRSRISDFDKIAANPEQALFTYWDNPSAVAPYVLILGDQINTTVYDWLNGANSSTLWNDLTQLLAVGAKLIAMSYAQVLQNEATRAAKLSRAPLSAVPPPVTYAAGVTPQACDPGCYYGTDCPLGICSQVVWSICDVGFGHCCCACNTCVFGSGVQNSANAPYNSPNVLCYWLNGCQGACGCGGCNGLTPGGCSCFPGDALVQLENGHNKRMDDVKIGDRVKVVTRSGKIAFEDIYLFGHQLPGVITHYIKITTASNTTLTLAPDHFVPLVPAGKPATWAHTGMSRARDVAPGATIFIAHSDGTQAVAVAAVQAVYKRGVYNPYTLGGYIIVDGVVASAHSSWVLDPLLDKMGASHLLPATYQVLFTPIRLLYFLLGKERMAVLAPMLADLGNAIVENRFAETVTAAVTSAVPACSILTTMSTGIVGAGFAWHAVHMLSRKVHAAMPSTCV